MGYLFGAPYMGSKTKIARDILKQLPISGLPVKNLTKRKTLTAI